MTEKDLLFRLEAICLAYRDLTSNVKGDSVYTPDEIGECLVYISGLITQEQFRREDPDQWEQAKRVLYERLVKKSPQTMFELSLGLPEGVGTVILDEITYGQMFMNEHYHIGLRK